jgi:hypothetical protein
MSFSSKRSRTIIYALLVLLVSAGILIFQVRHKPSDKKAYEEVVATMSINKAKLFFADYPQSPYREKLVDNLIEWCRMEKTKECYQMILECLPRESRPYQEVESYYKTHFRH